jgi:hypothetical protein
VDDEDAMAFGLCLALVHKENLVAVGFNEMALVYPFLETSEFGALCFCFDTNEQNRREEQGDDYKAQLFHLILRCF